VSGDYIFVTGAPGSKWSSVVRSIYFSGDINQSDFSLDRRYYHDASGKRQLMHLGSYFDPGMEFGDNFKMFSMLSKEEAEAEFDRPFTHGIGRKIVKSHFFAYHLDDLKEKWKDPIVLVYRDSDACLGWWIRCGHFNITYPKYDYYKNIDGMVKYVDAQNKHIKRFIDENEVLQVWNSLELAQALGLDDEGVYHQDYRRSDVKVYVYWSRYDGSQAFL
jgi:hypothetical protein